MRGKILIALFGLLIVSCNSNEAKTNDLSSVDSTKESLSGEPNITITGQVKNGAHATLVLEANSQQGAIKIGQATTDNDGNFKLTGEIVELGLYQLRLDQGKKEVSAQQQKAIPLTLKPGDEVTLELTFDNFNSSVVYKGTEWAEPLNTYMDKLNDFIAWQRTIANPRQYSQEQLMRMVMEQKKPLDAFIVQQIKENPSNPANILLMTNLLPMLGFEYYNPEHIQVLNEMSEAYQKSYPNLVTSQNIASQIQQLELEYKNYVAFVENKIAPEIALPNPKGDTLRLSDLKGNYVLIDFWASWCGPCRRDNPTNVRIYNTFKDENFIFFSVSLDKDKEKWIQAIKEDGLIWEHHVSDLLMWQTPLVQQYQFNAIPHTVIIDPEGKIIAQGLRGAELERKLHEIFS